MSDKSKIEWTDATWNPITGCTLVSEGCRNCYAARLAATRLQHHPSRAGLARVNAAGEAKFTGEVRLNEQWLDQPLRWKSPRRIFVCAHGDLFHESVPDEWIDRVFAFMALAPHHTFQVLTKRPERMREYLSWHQRPFRIASTALSVGRNLPDGHPGWSRDRWKVSPIRGCSQLAEWPLPNVWLGVSVEDQATADERIPHLLDTPAAIRFISAEPLLGPVDLTFMGDKPENGLALRLDALRGAWMGMGRDPFVHHYTAGLDWVIVGGESGQGARPMHPDWARSLRDQSAAASVAFHFKQWGEWAPTIGALDWTEIDDDPEISRFDHLEYDGSGWGERYKPMWDQEPTEDEVARVGKRRAGRRLDGVTHDGFPQVRHG